MLGKSGRWLCAAAMAVTASVTGAGNAGADPAPEGKELVVLGDSFSANAWDFMDADNTCMRRGKTAWPAQLGKLMGVFGTDRMIDVSCPGASIDGGPGWSMAQEAQKADKAGGFGPRTKLVTLQFGLNDKWGESSQTLWKSLQTCVFNLTEGCGPEAVAEGRMTDYNGVSANTMAARMRNAITYIRYYAPNARIVLVGYQELFPVGAEQLCLNFFGIAPYIQPRGRAVVEYFERIDQAQQDAARMLGIDFLDARSLTTGHGLCSDQPWVNGVLDPRTDLDGLFFHPSSQGDAAVAGAIHDRYGR
ncbi:SGNH/GDSL hydrolase family protein [Nocardia yamanashiensis]|uniref:SGNH/GDSL hydrolase family protein n=1 Tax=Nocardia yamanashiensis TaxID=209247 RepID=UPI001E5E4FC7|nr:SGNH/GDSL hydrolase family protein [Nocardia yamanashiensis]UGT38497.1 SGNH/GDSL hydrolase family protein [Nocardia yamanashiensis]